jgi:hypothetical protein
MKDLKKRIVNQQFKKVTFDGIEFVIKKMDALIYQMLAIKIKSGAANFEINIILDAIKDVKGLKVKHVVDSVEEFTAEELDSDLAFDNEYLQIYLGKNQETLIELYTLVSKDFMEFNENNSKKNLI